LSSEGRYVYAGDVSKPDRSQLSLVLRPAIVRWYIDLKSER
jgi:hypothetical protein